MIGLFGEEEEREGSDRWPPSSQYGMDGSDRGRALHEALVRLSLLMPGRPGPVDGVTVREYFNAIQYAAGVDSRSVTGLDRRGWVSLCGFLDVDADGPVRELKAAALADAGVDYDGSEDRQLRKDEVAALAARVSEVAR